MIYRLVEQLQKKAIPVQHSCRVLSVSRASYYNAQARPAKPLSCKVGVHLKAAFAASQQSYGSRRLVSALAVQGIAIGRYKARSLMRQAGIKPVWKRKFIHTTDSRHDLPIAENILARQFNPSAPNTAYVTDITYIRTGMGWLYLAMVLDLFSRKVVGWAMAPSMPASLVCDALQMAIGQRRPAPGLIVHSDRGSPVRQRPVPGIDCQARLRLQHEPPGQLLGQRRRGTLLPEPQDGAGLAANLCQPGGSKKRCHRLHRRFLKLQQAELRIGQSAALRLRAKHDSKKTYRCV